MRLKSKYRAFRDGGRVDAVESRQDEMPPEPTEPLKPVALEQTAPPQPEPPEQRQDDATLALRKQIESLRQSEQVRQQAPMLQEPMSREQRLTAWKADGLSDAEVQLFQRNPAMIDHPQITGFAVQRAKDAGIKRGTDEHLAAVEQIFNSALSHLQAQAEQPAMPERPAFFEPPAPRPSRVGYSAPVSRSIPSGGSGRRSSPGRVTLSPQEVEAARVSGISIEDYAKQKIEYERQRETGEYRDQR